MELVRRIQEILKGDKGVATSLIEAAATVALWAMLATVAIAGGLDAVDESKIQAAISDVNTIAQGVVTFYKDNSFFPLFKVGSRVGPNDDYFNNLVSENGTYPNDVTGTWDMPSETTTYLSSSRLLGHVVVPSDDTIEGHLLRNQINRRNAADGVVSSEDESAYVERGHRANDPQRGWSGSYIPWRARAGGRATLSETDPWGGKYLINVRMLHVKHFRDLGSTELLPNIAVIVISAGPNRTLETAANQTGEQFQALGDDIAFRIK